MMDEEEEVGEHMAYAEAYDNQDHPEQALEEELAVQVVAWVGYMKDEDQLEVMTQEALVLDCNNSEEVMPQAQEQEKDEEALEEELVQDEEVLEEVNMRQFQWSSMITMTYGGGAFIRDKKGKTSAYP